MAGGEGGKRRHGPGGIPDIKPLQVLGQHPVRRVRLDVYPLDPAPLDKIVDIGAAEGRGDGIVDGADGHPQGAGLFPIHIDPVLGHILQAGRPHPGQPRVLGRHPQQLVAGRHQFLVSQPGPVLQFKVETARPAKLQDGRRREGKHSGVPDLRKPGHGPPRQGVYFQIRPRPQVPILEHDESQPGILSGPGKAPAGHREDTLDGFLFIIQEIVPAPDPGPAGSAPWSTPAAASPGCTSPPGLPGGGRPWACAGTKTP